VSLECFPFSLLWPSLLTCSGHASMTATSLSFLEVFGLPTLFSLKYLANWHQESNQVRWRSCRASLGFGTLNLCLLYLFFSSFCCFFHATHVIHASSSRRCPLSGAIEACATRLCSLTFSLGLILEPRERIIYMLFVEKYKVKINANIFCFKKCVFFMVYLS